MSTGCDQAIMSQIAIQSQLIDRAIVSKRDVQVDSTPELSQSNAKWASRSSIAFKKDLWDPQTVAFVRDRKREPWAKEKERMISKSPPEGDVVERVLYLFQTLPVAVHLSIPVGEVDVMRAVIRSCGPSHSAAPVYSSSDIIQPMLPILSGDGQVFRDLHRSDRSHLANQLGLRYCISRIVAENLVGPGWNE